MQTFHKPQPKERKFLPADFKVTNWEGLQPFYEQLRTRPINSTEELQKWLFDRSELEGVVSEEAAWRYIHMTCDTGNEEYAKAYEQYVTNIVPELIPYAYFLNKKMMESWYTDDLKYKPGYEILIRSVKLAVRVFAPANIDLLAKDQLQSQQYGKLASEMSITRDGKEITLQQAATYLELPDRKTREEVYMQIQQRRLQDKDKLDTLYSTLVKERNKIATNAEYFNFRDYSFARFERFDYSPNDCFTFHDAVKEAVVPLLNEMAQKRKDQMKLDSLRPWDHAVDPQGRPPLKPFKDTQELVQKNIQVLDQLDPYFGNCLRTMQEMGRFDLGSRKGKAPGGYNMPLEESGVPFIFMNAANSVNDVVTMLHESGHAVHSFLMHDLPLNNFKHATAEMAELAAMSMELLTMDHWNIFFPQEEDAKRAKKEHLEGIVQRLAWIAAIDKFQHWVYTHPTHTVAGRETAWKGIIDAFSDQVTDWSGYEHIKYNLWQKQLHLFEAPFYYIEYGIAQMGALHLWRNYGENPTKALEVYKKALQLGYTQPMTKTYNTALVKVDFGLIHTYYVLERLKKEWKKLV